MWNPFYSHIERFATWPVVALLFVLFVLCAQGFEIRRKSLGDNNPGLDGRCWYSPEEARDFFQAAGERGRRIYAATELTLDILFPLIYGILFAALLIHIYSRDTARYLTIVPLLTVAADVLENITVSYMAWQFDGRASPVAHGAAILTAVKTVLIVLSFVLILVGALAAIWRTYRSPA
jgi:hypothetical protein